MSKEYTRLVSIIGELPFSSQVIFQDNFSYSLQWTKGGGVGDSIFELTPNIYKHGGQSLHLKTRTTDTAQADSISAERFMHFRPSEYVTLLSNFYSPDLTKSVYIYFKLSYADGTYAHSAGIRFRPNTPDFQYLNSTNGYTSITGSELSLNNLAWHQISLIINFAQQKYISLQFDQTLIDLSTITHYSVANGGNIYLSPKIEIVTNAASPAEIHIDDIVLHEF